jgi:hypothetical protein
LDWRRLLEIFERCFGRAHLFWWLIPPSAIAIVTAGAGYLDAAPLYLLMPAVLGAAVFMFSLMDRLRHTLRQRCATLPGTIRELAVALDRTDGHVKLGFVPAKNIRRLRIRLDQGGFAEGLLGVGDAWTKPNGAVIADLHDLVRGERQVIQLTDVEERTEGSDVVTTRLLFGWRKGGNTIVNIPPHSLCRARVALIVNDEPEEIHYGFFAISWHDPSDTRGFPALRIIGQDQFNRILRWDDASMGFA